MRSATIIAIACLLLLVGSVSAAGSQAQARAIETRWKNCSQILRGRLGALYPEDGTQFTDFQGLSFAGYTVNFSPCLVDQKGNYVDIRDSWDRHYYFDQVFCGGSAVASCPGDARLIAFTMPDKVGEVAQITSSYRDTSDMITLNVVSQCNASATKSRITNMTALGSTWTMTIQTVEACARFPYTNKSMPAGGVAALIICILTFILQAGACFKYHKDNKGHSPLDGDQM